MVMKLHAFRLSAVVSLLLSVAVVSADPRLGETAGEPWTGATGVTETVAQIMARAQEADAAQARVGNPQPRFGPGPRADLDGHERDPGAPGVSPRSKVDPNPARASTTDSPQALGINFLGANFADATGFPPDTMGAAGPTQYLVAVNGRIRTFNKATGLADGALNTSTDVFFNSVMTPPVGNNGTAYPRIRFDRLTGRWFLIMIDLAGNGTLPNRVLLAVSSGPIITNSSSFTLFFFQHDAVAPAGDTGDFADYPTLGLDANALYIGDTVFDFGGSFVGCTGFVVRKSSVLGAGPIVVTAFRRLVSGSVDGPFSPQGVDNYDPAADEGYFVGTSATTAGRLILRRVSNPGGIPTISGNILIPTAATASPIPVPHLGNNLPGGSYNGKLDAVDNRLLAAHLRNGRLWTAHNIQVNASGVASSSGGRDGSRWYELQDVATGGTPSVFQSGTVFDSAASSPTSYWIPSIMVSGQGHAALGFSNAGANAYINAGTVGRFTGDPLGTTQTPVLYTNTTAAYNPAADSGTFRPRRWGFYSYTSLDPSDDMTMWTIQEYCSSLNNWGVQVVQLLAPPPATPASASAAVYQGQSNVNVILTGTTSGGSGFFDPGAGPAASPFNRIAASIGGTGVFVNSITYTNPTTLTLNVTVAAGAATGARTVTITNPDGQSVASLAGILNVAAPADLQVTQTATPSPVAAGYNVAYVVTVQNNGPANASGVFLTDTYPSFATFVSSTPAATSQVANVLSYDLGALASGASTAVRIVVNLPVTATGTAPNTATVGATEFDSFAANNHDTLAPIILADSNSNGLPDQWEFDNFGVVGIDPNADQDGDGFTNLQEYLAGTDPRSAASRPVIVLVEVVPNGANQDFRLTFATLNGRTYRVESSDDLATQNFTPLGPDVTGTGANVLITDASAVTLHPQRFYRVRVVQVP